MPASTQNLLDLIDCLRQTSGLRAQHNHKEPPAWSDLEPGAKRNQDRVVLFVLAEDGRLALCQDADNLPHVSTHPDARSHDATFLIGKKSCRGVYPDDHNIAAVEIV